MTRPEKPPLPGTLVQVDFGTGSIGGVQQGIYVACLLEDPLSEEDTLLYVVQFPETLWAQRVKPSWVTIIG
jgi:hypothetical protein